MTEPAGLIASAIMADVAAPAGRSPSSPAIPNDLEHWMMGDLLEVEGRVQVAVKLHLGDLQKSRRARRHETPGSVSKTVDLATALVDDAVVTSSPGAGRIVECCTDKLTGQLVRTGEEEVSLTVILSDSEDARDKAEQEHKNFVRKVRSKTKVLEDHIIAEQARALSCYHGVLRSVRDIVKAADECNVSHADTLFQMQFLFKGGRKV